MENSSFSTEREQYAVGVVRDALKNVYAPLFDKMKELESLQKTEDVLNALLVIKLRLDALGKIEMNLLAPLQEEYSFIEKSVGELQPGELTNIIEERNKKLVSSFMQGI